MKRSALFVFYASAQFIVLTVIAMLLYPGGNFADKEATHYRLFQNFFSDLGGTHTVAGVSNYPSMVLFIIALCTVGIAMICFSTTPKVYLGKKRGSLTQKCASASLVFGGICFILVALIPWNVNFAAHLFFVKLAFSLLPLYVLCSLILQIQSRWPRSYQLANFFYLVCLVIYLSILFFGPPLGQKEGLEIQAIAQKCIVYASIVLLGYQAWGIVISLKRPS